ncbi:MAG TPA: LysR family transcriptional regulator [Ensifer sp.]|nr:LysR family transcriptional regulator [Ensifer sp.]
MRFKNLDLNLLVAFDALLTEESVSRAGEKINLSQSAMSAALRRMREYFGDELFVTIGRRTRPTALALELAEPVRRILGDVNTNIIGREPFDPETSDRMFSIAASDYFTRVVLSKFIPRLREIARNICIDIWPVTGSSTVTSFANGEIDVFVSVDKALLPDLPTAKIWTEDFVGIAWKDNQYIGETLTLDNFRDLGHVAVRLGIYRATPIDEIFVTQAGISRRIEVTTGAFDQIPELLVGTPRIAMLQRRLANHYAEILPIRVMDLPFKKSPIQVSMQWHRHNSSDAGLKWLRAALLKWCSAHRDNLTFKKFEETPIADWRLD